MKRIKELYHQIYDLDNLRLADKAAGKGKSDKIALKRHRNNVEANLIALQQKLIEETYNTSKYRVFTIVENKERTIHSLPYYPDRIIHHAIMNVLEPHFMRWFTSDTYSSIKGRGIHKACRKLKRTLENATATTYCLKLDIKKFYPSIDNSLLKKQLSTKIKDTRLLRLLYEIIDSAKGLPIGNYLSQYLANFYLTGFDHWIKENVKARYYFRYADDVVILHHDKAFLHNVLHSTIQYLSEKLNLEVKKNYQIFPVAARGIDYLGYKFFHGYTLIRPSIKKRYKRMMARAPNAKSKAAYNGWLKHCDSKHLQKTVINKSKIKWQT